MSDQTIHELKAWPCYFGAVWSGEKTFEMRVNDRGFMPGDRLLLREYDPDATASPYTGRELKARIGYLLNGGRLGLAEGYCVMSLRDVVATTYAARTGEDYPPSPVHSRTPGDTA